MTRYRIKKQNISQPITRKNRSIPELALKVMHDFIGRDVKPQDMVRAFGKEAAVWGLIIKGAESHGDYSTILKYIQQNGVIKAHLLWVYIRASPEARRINRKGNIVPLVGCGIDANKAVPDLDDESGYFHLLNELSDQHVDINFYSEGIMDVVNNQYIEDGMRKNLYQDHFRKLFQVDHVNIPERIHETPWEGFKF
jgi:hypothetical protein